MTSKRETTSLPRRAESSSNSFSEYLSSSIRSAFNYLLDLTVRSDVRRTLKILKPFILDEPSCLEDQSLYNLHGRWESLECAQAPETVILENITENLDCSVSMARSVSGSIEHSHIIKRWKPDHPNKAFRSTELILYTYPGYLAPLQGDTVPRVICVSKTGACVDVMMEAPDSTVWFEASPNMPEVLKTRCIDAYCKLHARGVLHGSVDLQHILIGGNGKVHIVDFTKSRVRVPQVGFGIPPATEEEFEMELRIVKFKLNYGPAKALETSRYLNGNLAIEIEELSQKHPNYTFGVPEELIYETGDVEPKTFPGHALWREMNTDKDRTPLKFENPSLSRPALDTAWEDLKDRLTTEEERYWRSYCRLNADISRKETPQFREGTRTKRKASEEPEDTPPSKRLCHSLLSETTAPVPDNHSQDSSTSRSSTNTLQENLEPAAQSADTEAHQETEARQRDSESEENTFPMPYKPTHKPTSPRSYSGTCNLLPLPRASGSSSTPRDPTLRESVDQSYDRRKAYYVPYPPLESRVSIERARFIGLQNAAKCIQAGLPYYLSSRRIEYGVPVRPRPRHSLFGVAIGDMKRKQDQLEQLAFNGRVEKKPRLEIIDDETDPDRAKRGYGSMVLDLPAGEIISYDKYKERQGSGPQGKEPSTELRGILKATPPIKLYSYNKEDWPSVPETPPSPKLAPKIAVPAEECRAIYNSVPDSRLDKEALSLSLTHVAPAPDTPPIRASEDLAEELFAAFQELPVKSLDENDWTDYRERPNSRVAPNISLDDVYGSFKKLRNFAIRAQLKEQEEQTPVEAQPSISPSEDHIERADCTLMHGKSLGDALSPPITSH